MDHHYGMLAKLYRRSDLYWLHHSFIYQPSRSCKGGVESDGAPISIGLTGNLPTLTQLVHN